MSHPWRAGKIAGVAFLAAALALGIGPASTRAAEFDLVEAHTTTQDHP